MESSFDPVLFMNQQQTKGADIRFFLHNAGDWKGIIGMGERDVGFITVDQEDKDNPGTKIKRLVARVYLQTDDPKAAPEGATPPMRVRLDIFLDTVSGNLNVLDWGPGMNKGLGYLLYATGYQDKFGVLKRPWSWPGLKGNQLMYKVRHSPRKDTGEPQAEVQSVAPVTP